MSQNPFFYFDSLSYYFPNINSISNFIESSEFLADLEISLVGTSHKIKKINNEDYLEALNGILQNIQNQIINNTPDYEGSDFFKVPFQSVFKDKEIGISRNDERSNGQENIVADKDWYVFNANYGTSEEKQFVELFGRLEGTKLNLKTFT